MATKRQVPEVTRLATRRRPAATLIVRVASTPRAPGPPATERSIGPQEATPAPKVE